MNNLMWLLKWILKAAIFLALFVFAMDNRQDVTVHFFFGAEWRAPLVLVVLAAFATGLGAGVLAMVPRWWRQRLAASLARRQSANDSQLPHSTQTPHES
jgi:lipopolysaccharide assembly protein A